MGKAIHGILFLRAVNLQAIGLMRGLYRRTI